MRCARPAAKKHGKQPRQTLAAQAPLVNPVQALLPLLVQSLAGAASGQTFEVSVWARAVVDALMAKLVSRWPKDGEQCPFTGLNRAQIYELSQPGPDGQPLIKTISFAQPGG